MENKVRRQLRFFGRVQGVGFRFTSKHAASYLGLTGWVMNDYDDTVLMEVQGTEEKIAKMIEILDKDMFIEIDRIEKETLPLLEHEGGFYIKD